VNWRFPISRYLGASRPGRGIRSGSGLDLPPDSTSTYWRNDRSISSAMTASRSSVVCQPARASSGWTSRHSADVKGGRCVMRSHSSRAGLASGPYRQCGRLSP
jgi:hypothetical protein